MSRIKTSALKKMQHAIDEIHIYAHEGDIYTVGLKIGDSELTVCQKDDTPISFRSLALAKAAFKKCKHAKTQIICATAYDEMIGHDTHSIGQ